MCTNTLLRVLKEHEASAVAACDMACHTIYQLLVAYNYTWIVLDLSHPAGWPRSGRA